MMDKLIISKEQEEAFKRYRLPFTVKEAMRAFTNNHGTTEGSLNDFTPQQFALLLCGWYEAKDPFRVGDWVAFHDNNIWNVTHKIRGGDTHFNISCGSEMKGPIHKDHIRHATPDEIAQEKERRKWSSIGREVNEWHIGDLFEYQGEIREVKPNHERRYANQMITLVCPAEKRFDTHV